VLDDVQGVVFMIRGKGLKGGPGMPQMLTPNSATMGAGSCQIFRLDGLFGYIAWRLQRAPIVIGYTSPKGGPGQAEGAHADVPMMGAGLCNLDTCSQIDVF